MNESKKYSRSLHAHISKGTTSDDRFMPDGYLRYFASLDNLVVTEKLDGQNNCLSKKGVFARSHASTSALPWDKPLIQRWNLIKNDLNDLEVFGENMYGIHSIGYKKLESYFYVFAIRENDRWLSWEEVKFYASLLDFPTVPQIKIKVDLKQLFNEKENENNILEKWLIENLGMTWEDSVNTSGLLGGYDTLTNKECSEGFVVRNGDSFTTNQGSIKVASNEFNNLFKLVRANHVQTDEHWTKHWKPARLKDYSKYGWDSYHYLENR